MKNFVNLVLLVTAFLQANHAQGQLLDASFGTDGKAIISFGNNSVYFSDMHVFENGKTISTGFNDQVLNPIFITQQLSNGALDTSFNHTGIKQISFGSSSESVLDINNDQNGNILLAGSSNGSYVLARLLPTGIFDSTFALNGISIVSFGAGNGSTIKRIALQEDGKIVAIGNAYSGSNFDFSAARFNTNGSLDSTFGTSGKALFNFSGFNDFGNDLIIETDGKITVAGRALSSNGNPKFALLRLNSNGSLDQSFGTNGKTITSIDADYEEVIEKIVKLNDGSYIAGGYWGGDFAVLKYTSNGIIDNSFGTSGHVTTDFGDYQDKAFALAVDNDGKILLAGYVSDTVIGGFFQAGIARYNSNGSLDNTFDEDGKLTIVLGSYSSQFGSIHLFENGDILLGGSGFENTSGGGSIANFAFARLNADNASIIFNSVDERINFTVFPNPAEQFIKVAQQNGIQNCTVKIHDISGKFIYQSAFQSPEIAIDLRDFEIGIYFISIANQNHVSSTKFVKQ